MLLQLHLFVLFHFSANRPNTMQTSRRSCCRAPSRTCSPLTTRLWRRSRLTAQCLFPTATTIIIIIIITISSSSSNHTAGTTSLPITFSTADRPTRQMSTATTSTWCSGGFCSWTLLCVAVRFPPPSFTLKTRGKCCLF